WAAPCATMEARPEDTSVGVHASAPTATPLCLALVFLNAIVPKAAGSTAASPGRTAGKKYPPTDPDADIDPTESAAKGTLTLAPAATANWHAHRQPQAAKIIGCHFLIFSQLQPNLSSANFSSPQPSYHQPASSLFRVGTTTQGWPLRILFRSNL